MKVVLRGRPTTSSATSATTTRVPVCADLHLFPVSLEEGGVPVGAVPDRTAQGRPTRHAPHGGERTANRSAARAAPPESAWRQPGRGLQRASQEPESRHRGPCTGDEVDPRILKAQCRGEERLGAAQGPSGVPLSPLCRVWSGRQVRRQPTVKKQSACKAPPVTDRPVDSRGPSAEWITAPPHKGAKR